MKIWECKIGIKDDVMLQGGADFPMRQAVGKMFIELTGREPDFLFSGWAAKLSEAELAVVEDRLPSRDAAVELSKESK